MKCGESDGRNDEYSENYSPQKFFTLMIDSDAPLIIDIGAHKGESVMFFNSIFPKAEIYSVEPDPESYAALVEYLGDEARALNAAVSDQNGTFNFYQYDKSHLNSLHAINIESIDSLGYAEESTPTEVDVRCMTLDSMIDELEIAGRDIDLLKIDAQGAEAEILAGAKQSLGRINNITLELNLFDFYSRQNSFLEVESLLPGFELYAITKLSQNPKNFRTDWVEAFYTRSKS